MGRIAKHKSAKATATKRRKKGSTFMDGSSSSSSGVRRTPASFAESVLLANGGVASPTGSTSTAGSSTPSSSTANGKECEQCGNPTLLDGVASSRAWATNKKQLAPNGCQICDFVTYRKSQRPCVHCDRSACEHFCEWCGTGYHTKCAKARDENVHAPNGFCCRKCEAEQADDDTTTDTNSMAARDAITEELGARCGSCRLPFTAGVARDASDDTEAKGPPPLMRIEESGFRVNQSVLVENEEVLYNACITDVDLQGERIKIHFIRWSKTFDNWYAMDDERINESLACDCCNRWFHIGCLPPIKSSGRFKDTTYVCPTCIGDAKHFHNRTKAKSIGGADSLAALATQQSRSRKSSVSEDAVPTAKRKNVKPIVTSDDEIESHNNSNATFKASDSSSNNNNNNSERSKKKRKLSVSSDSPIKKNAPELSRAALHSRLRSRSKSPEATVIASETATHKDPSTDEAREDEMDATVAATPPSPPTSPSPESTGDVATVTAPAAADDVSATTDESDATAATRGAQQVTHDVSSNDSNGRDEQVNSDNASSHLQTDLMPSSSPIRTQTHNSPVQAGLTTTTTTRRRTSSHSVSSLLNSSSPNEQSLSPPRHHPHLVPLSMLDENRRSLTSSFDVLVKSELRNQSHQLLTSSSSSSSAASATSRSSIAVTTKATANATFEPYASASTAMSWQMRAPAATMNYQQHHHHQHHHQQHHQQQQPAAPNRGRLSAFDILRQVATQSIGNELDAAAATAPPTAPPVKAKKERQRASAAKAKALKAEKLAAAAAVAAATAANNKTNGKGATTDASDDAQANDRNNQMNAFVDLHFDVRKEMYLKFCILEEQGLLDRDTAQLLRSLIYPTSDKFQDLKFVYLVNRDLPPLYLTKRLLEVVPTSLGGTGVALPPSASSTSTSTPSSAASAAAPTTSSSHAHGSGATTPRNNNNNNRNSAGPTTTTHSVASSPASTKHTPQALPTIVPPGLTIPSFSEIIATEKAAALLHQQQQRQHQQLQHHLQQQHQTLQAAALATTSALELRKKAATMRPDVIVKELAPLPPVVPSASLLSPVSTPTAVAASAPSVAPAVSASVVSAALSSVTAALASTSTTTTSTTTASTTTTASVMAAPSTAVSTFVQSET